MNPLVSIIIPVYNAEKFLAETIRSAMDQTWGNKEILIIDDGSTDNSLAVARQYENDFIRVFAQANAGASAARNTGLQNAKGEYIQFLDADDLLSNNKIAVQLQKLIPCPNYVGLCTTVHFPDGANPLSSAGIHEWLSEGSDDPVDFLIKLYGGALIGPQYGGMITIHAWLTPKAVLEKAGPWNESLTVDDDGEFFCRVILASNGIRYAEEATVYYRKFSNQTNLSAQKNYGASNSLLQSTILKVKYLTGKTTDQRAKLVSCRLLMDTAFNLYPYFKTLSGQAEKKAMELCPGYRHKPFAGGLKSLITAFFGWKLFKRLQYLKQKIK